MVAVAHTLRPQSVGYVTPEARHWFKHGGRVLHDALGWAAESKPLVEWRRQDRQLLPLLLDHRLLDRPDVIPILNHVTIAITYYEQEFVRIHGRRVNAAPAAPAAPTAVPAARFPILTQPNGNTGRIGCRNNAAALPWTAEIAQLGRPGGSHVLGPANQGAAPGSSAVNAIIIGGAEEKVQYQPGWKRVEKRPLQNGAWVDGSGPAAGSGIILDDVSEMRRARPAIVPRPYILPAVIQGGAAAPVAVPSSADNGAEIQPGRPVTLPPVLPSADRVGAAAPPFTSPSDAANSAVIRQASPAGAPAALPGADQSDATTPSPPVSSTSDSSSENAPKRRRNGRATMYGLRDRYAPGEQPTDTSAAYHLQMAVPQLKKHTWMALKGAGIEDPAKVEKPGRKRKGKSPDKAALRAAHAVLKEAAASNASPPPPAPSSPVETRQPEPATVAEPVDVPMADVESEAEDEWQPEGEPTPDGELILEDPDEVARRNRQLPPELDMDDALQAMFDADAEAEAADRLGDDVRAALNAPDEPVESDSESSSDGDATGSLFGDDEPASPARNESEQPTRWRERTPEAEISEEE